VSKKHDQPNGDAAGDIPLAERAKPRWEDLPPAAQRALREAEERRAAIDARKANKPPEVGGPDGEEPTRYGDWEKNGRAYDF